MDHHDLYIEQKLMDPPHGSTVILLGDVALGNRGQGLDTLHRVKKKGGLSRLSLVCGNHDDCWSGHLHGWKHQKKYLEVFDTVHDFLKMKAPKTNFRPPREILLSHFPYTGDHTDHDRYTQYRLPDEGNWLIHGHTHSDVPEIERQINVAFGARPDGPVSWDDILSHIRYGHMVDAPTTPEL